MEACAFRFMAKRQTRSKPKRRLVRLAKAGPAHAPKRSGLASPPPPSRGSGYFEAVTLYEQGLEALQRRDHEAAAELFHSVLRRYPEEKELHERVRLYLNICERQVTPRQARPETLDERLYAATLALNRGRYDEAISHLHLVRDEEPDNDHALYMLAAAHAQRGDHAEAVAHLERAIALNPENRGLARRDPDFESLRDDEAFRGAVEVVPAPLAPRSETRRRPRGTKTAR